jgi:hypothetical protein
MVREMANHFMAYSKTKIFSVPKASFNTDGGNLNYNTQTLYQHRIKHYIYLMKNCKMVNLGNQDVNGPLQDYFV